MSIEGALKELVRLFDKWGLGKDGWCVIGEWALILQNWNVPKRKNILDVWQYIKDIKKAAREKGDKEVMNAANELLHKYAKE